MAIFTIGGLITSIRGRYSGSSMRMRGSSVVVSKTASKTSSKISASAKAMAALYPSAASAWVNLASSERSDWNAAAKLGIVPTGVYTSGINAFFAYYIRAIGLGLNYPTSCPSTPPTPTVPVISGVTAVASALDIKLNLSTLPGSGWGGLPGVIIFWKNGTYGFSSARSLGTFSPGASSPWDITTGFAKAYAAIGQTPTAGDEFYPFIDMWYESGGTLMHWTSGSVGAPGYLYLYFLASGTGYYTLS